VGFVSQVEFAADDGATGRRLVTKAIAVAALLAALLPGAQAAAATATPALAGTGFTTDAAGLTAVIVRATADHVAQARSAVETAGGTIGADLSIVNGFAATIPASALAALQQANSIASVTPDFEATSQSADYDPYTDAGSSVGLSYDTGYIQYWNNGYTGSDVGVALIDSGVTPVPSLAAPGKVIYGPDFTPTGYFSQQRGLDGYGHGTFMAGLIAGRNPAARAPYINSGPFVGVAPDAHIVSVKVADYSGATTESAVIAGIGWAVQHRDDPGLNIKVMNLSFGVRDGLPYTADPLDAAAEAAWKAGITVVAAAGNDGRVGLMAPANDPYVIAVGAVDGGDTISVSDDKVASFSDLGDGSRDPDFAALGTHIVSLRDPGSYVDHLYGTGPGSVNGELMRGSGTSESAAITSGAVALLLSQRPDLTPDQVKATLKAAAMPLPNLTQTNAGAGALNMAWAFDMPTVDDAQTWPSAASWISPRGGVGAGAHASSTPAGSVWTGSRWSAINWSGRKWLGSVWTGSMWTGSMWTGSMWTGSMWTGSMWTGSVWAGSVWAGSVWADSEWQTDGWS
jgi:serine protease AprX